MICSAQLYEAKYEKQTSLSSTPMMKNNEAYLL